VKPPQLAGRGGCGFSDIAFCLRPTDAGPNEPRSDRNWRYSPYSFWRFRHLVREGKDRWVLSTAAWCWALNRGHICPHRRSIPSVPSDGVGTTQQCRSLRRSHLRRRRPDIVPLWVLMSSAVAFANLNAPFGRERLSGTPTPFTPESGIWSARLECPLRP